MLSQIESGIFRNWQCICTLARKVLTNLHIDEWANEKQVKVPIGAEEEFQENSNSPGVTAYLHMVRTNQKPVTSTNYKYANLQGLNRQVGAT